MSAEKKKPIILIVEDEPALARILKANLSMQGFDIALAHSGEEALRLVKELTPRLILLDVMLPDKDGYTVLKEIRQQESKKKRRSKVPVIMQSARGLPTEILCETEGISGFVHKPYKLDDLLAAVKGALGRSPH